MNMLWIFFHIAKLCKARPFHKKIKQWVENIKISGDISLNEILTASQLRKKLGQKFIVKQGYPLTKFRYVLDINSSVWLIDSKPKTPGDHRAKTLVYHNSYIILSLMYQFFDYECLVPIKWPWGLTELSGFC